MISTKCVTSVRAHYARDARVSHRAHTPHTHNADDVPAARVDAVTAHTPHTHNTGDVPAHRNTAAPAGPADDSDAI